MPRILIFDTETTGLPKTKIINPVMFHLWPHIVQFSYIIYDTKSHGIIKMTDSIIKVPPTVIISAESTEIHGITNEMSQNLGVELIVVLLDFFQAIQTVEFVVGHNVLFDVNMVKIELLRLIENVNCSYNDKRIFKDILYQVTYISQFRCTMEETKDFCNIMITSKKGDLYKKFPSLSELYQKLYGTKPNNLHNSLHDVLITLISFVKFEYREDAMNKCAEIGMMMNRLQIV